MGAGVGCYFPFYFASEQRLWVSFHGEQRPGEEKGTTRGGGELGALSVTGGSRAGRGGQESGVTPDLPLPPVLPLCRTSLHKEGAGWQEVGAQHVPGRSF